ncbi:Trafficking kinesin-binding protein 1 [Galemys pyrenaicus]|uniref:Trafficking kinesin-binding protein 1 n=1 Tax=Galemys pyrenaicus TaxID=202257 RepID=A0A8J6ARK2_GALPY|nr:Trafficking kinesin-binding protein 1 [Galemys pyrenaicus]
MQKFIEADYYELDWYYEECSDAMSLGAVGGEEECYEYDCQEEEQKPARGQRDSLDLLEEVLCAERVGQMTKTYNDIDAVTRLLEEKERDLELAARIGQSLLKKNKTLTERNELLEEQVEHIREEVSQLRHELSMKEELLQFYTSTAEESEPESVCSTPLKRNESSSSVQNYFHLDSLQKKLKDLEEENVVLRSEACQLKTETITYEEKEQQLVNDCVKELRDANVQIASISEELAKKTEDAARQQEEITHLLSQIVDLQKKAKACAVENEELVQHLGAAKDAQRQLTAELRELEDKYAECMEMLHEAQEELKNLRNKTMPNATSRRYHSLGLFPMDSLAAEIEGTMRKELQLEEPESPDIAHQKRVFETVRNINQVVKQRSLTPSPMNIPGSNQSSAMNSLLSSCVSTPRSSFYGSDIGNVILDNKTNSIILEAESADQGNEDRKKPGTPGTPGSHDLETALRRLSLRRENYLSERRFFEEEQERKLRELAEKGELLSGSLTPTESIMSLGTHSRFSEFTGFSGTSFSSRSYLPEKLQIVKPLEGSATLHHWQQLAQPHLGGILDPRPGVVTKGFRTLDVDLDEVYCLNDFEEDDTGDHISLPGLATSTPVQHPETSGERSRARVTVSGSRSYPSRPQACPEEMQEPPAATEEEEEEGSAHHPGKCMSQTNSTFTFTTCRILHPSDELTRVTPSLNSAPTPACGSTSHLKSTPVATPCTPRRLSLAESFTNTRESTTTMSTSLGLVWLLKERGISAAVYDPQSWDRAGRGSLLQSYTPRMAVIPSTPPNSPMQTPISSPPSFEFKCTSPPYDNFLASKPASSILREVREKKNVRSSESQTDVSVSNLNLVDKVRRFGVAKVVNLGRAHIPTLAEEPGPLLCGPPGPAQTFVAGGLIPEGLPLGCPAVTNTIGGLQLNSGIRRNRSFPTMVGSSMQMKAPVTLTSGILMGAKLPKQTSLRPALPLFPPLPTRPELDKSTSCLETSEFSAGCQRFPWGAALGLGMAPLAPVPPWGPCPPREELDPAPCSRCSSRDGRTAHFFHGGPASPRPTLLCFRGQSLLFRGVTFLSCLPPEVILQRFVISSQARHLTQKRMYFHLRCTVRQPLCSV